MKENLTTFTLFSIILTTIVGLFAALGYPLWAFPVTILMSCAIFYMYLRSSLELQKYNMKKVKDDKSEEVIRNAHDKKVTYQIVKGLLNILPSPYVLIDRNGRLTYINLQAKSIIPDFQIGSHISTVFRSPIFLRSVENALRNDKEEKLSFEIQSPQFRQLKAHIFFISSNKLSQNFNDIFIQFTDESSYIKAEKVRTDFVANASHELRTPLASIIGYIETLQGHAKKDPKMHKLFLELMSKQAGKMERLIQDLMSLSRLEIEETKPITSETSLGTLIFELISTLEPLAAENKVQLTNKISKKLSPVFGDISQLRQLFSNLIENAIKYSGQKSTIKVYVSKEKEKNMIGIVVEDNGSGIAPEHLYRLTERFYRANTNVEVERDGTGLGLAIAKHILIRHQGRLQIDSKLGEGSRFTAWLPKPKTKKPK